MPMPNHCIDCDNIATVTLSSVPYCARCGIKVQQKGDLNGKSKRNIRRKHGKTSRAL